MTPPKIVLLLVLLLSSATYSAVPPIKQLGLECYPPLDDEMHWKFPAECGAIFDSIKQADDIRSRAFLSKSRSKLGVRNILSMRHRPCYFTAVGISRINSDITIDDWVDVWPTLQDGINSILQKCVKKNLNGHTEFVYAFPSPWESILLSLEDGGSAAYALYEYFAGYDGSSDSPSSSDDSSLSPPPPQNIDHTVVEMRPDAPGNRTSEADLEAVRARICRQCPSCWENSKKFLNSPIVASLVGGAIGSAGTAIAAYFTMHATSHTDQSVATVQAACDAAQAAMGAALDACKSENVALWANLAALRQANPTCPYPNF